MHCSGPVHTLFWLELPGSNSTVWIWENNKNAPGRNFSQRRPRGHNRFQDSLHIWYEIKAPSSYGPLPTIAHNSTQHPVSPTGSHIGSSIIARTKLEGKGDRYTRWTRFPEYKNSTATILVFFMPVFEILQCREIPKQNNGIRFSGIPENTGKISEWIWSDSTLKNSDRPVFEAGIHHCSCVILAP